MRDESIKAEKFVRPAQTCGVSFAGTGNQRDGKEAKMNENHVMNTYSRSDLNFVKGHGPWLTDIHGEEYLDFVSGIAVNCGGDQESGRRTDSRLQSVLESSDDRAGGPVVRGVGNGSCFFQ